MKTFWTAERWTALALALGPLTWAFLGTWRMLEGSEPTGGDFASHLAEVVHLQTGLAAGKLAGWNPQAALGFPLGYYYQFLPHLLLAALAAPFGSVGLTVGLFKLSITLALGLLPLATWRWLRPHATPERAVATALLVLAVSCRVHFGTTLEMWLSRGVWTQLLGLLVLALALPPVMRAVDGGGRLVDAALAFAVVGLTHVFFGMVLGLLVGAWWLSAPARASVLRTLGLLGLTALLTAFFTVPAFLHGRWFGGWNWETRELQDGLGPAEMLRLLATGAMLDQGRAPILTVLFALGLAGTVAALLRGRASRLDRFTALAAAGTTFLLTGRELWATPLDRLPGFTEVQYGRWIAAFHLAAVLLAGRGLADLAGLVAPAASGRSRRGVAVAVAAALVGVLAADRWQAFRYRALTLDDLVPGSRADVMAVFGDLQAHRPARFWAHQQTGLPHYFLFSLASIHAHRNGIVAAGVGAQDSPSRFYVVHFTPRRHARLFGVDHVVGAGALADSAPGQGPGPPDFRAGPYGVWRLPREQGAGAFFDVVSAETLVAGTRDDLHTLLVAWMESPLPRQGRHLLVSFDPPARPFLEVRESFARPCRHLGDCGPFELAVKVVEREPASPGFVGRVLDEQEELDAYQATVEAERAGHVLLKVSYHPNWRAFVDGTPRPAEMLSPSLLGVAVEPGRHRVRFEYHRPGLQKGLLLLALVVAAAAWAGERRRWAPPPPPASPR